MRDIESIRIKDLDWIEGCGVFDCHAEGIEDMNRPELLAGTASDIAFFSLRADLDIVLVPIDDAVPLKALDMALNGIKAHYDRETAAFIALQMEYAWSQPHEAGFPIDEVLACFSSRETREAWYDPSMAPLLRFGTEICVTMQTVLAD